MAASADNFVHLHNHSDYSLLHGALRVADLVRFAKEQEMGAIAVTDHGNLFGAVDFFHQAGKAGVKPILGMEAYVVRDRRAELPAETGPVCRLVLLAENAVGWKNLMKLSSFGYLEGLGGGKPRVDDELLRQYAEGIIALSGGPSGEVTRALSDGDLVAARAVVDRYRDIFGTDSFFLEIQNHGVPAEERVRSLAAQLAAESGARLVATNDCLYRTRENAVAHDVLMAVQLGKEIDDPSRWRYPSDQNYLKTAAEMRALFVEFPDACDNTLEIAERCDVKLERTSVLPAFALPKPFETPEAYLEHLSREGALQRYGATNETIEKRLAFELGVIEKMGFAGYFLIVGDFVQAAKDLGISVGPGRGSAAGSLVCYSIGITDVDPLEHDLLFERFLNPERVSMPDIDIDFCFERREEVIDYVIQKYGKESVCQIITYGTMQARGVLRDVGRALGMGFGEVDRIAKMVPEELGITLADALEKSEELRNVREEDPRYDRLVHTALELEGLKRHSSIHAAGILIAPGDLTEHVPLHKTGKDEVTTQWDMNKVEAMGLLKMDFLGLRTLTVIDKALRFLPELGGPQMEAGAIPLDDPAVYEMLGHGETVGVFQLESSGMQEILRKLKPSGFDDITAVNALYRPGPLGAGMVDDFIERKHGRKQIEYAHPMLAPVLEETYGVILYQEQVMRIAGDMAGYSLGQADQLRRAMGKKKVEEMERHKTIFVEGALERDVRQDTAEHIFDLMAFFAGYGFNKSHSASYAVLAVQTAWLKVHWPAAFMASTLTSEMNNTDRVFTLVEECRRMGLKVHPPDVNLCGVDFRPHEGGVLFGLGAVKNVGRGAIEAIVEARERLGRPFRSLFEFCEEIDLGRVNRRVIEALVQAGALDSVPGRREQKLEALTLALTRAQRRARDRDTGQGSLFGAVEQDSDQDGVLPEVPAWDARTRLARERELLGVYLSGHPLDDDRDVVRWLGAQTTKMVQQVPERTGLALCGILTAKKIVTSRRTGALIAFLTVDDFDGNTEMICMGEPYEQARTHLEVGEPLVFVARATRREGEEENKLRLEKAYPLDQACIQQIRAVHLTLPAEVGEAEVRAIMEAVAAHPGRCPLYLHVTVDGEETQVRAHRAAIAPVPDFLHRIIAAVGAEAVRPDLVPVTALVGPDDRGWRRRRKAEAGAS